MPLFQRYPLLFFGLLAYGFSWLVWLIGISQLAGDIRMDNPKMSLYLLVGSFGPTLATFVWTGILSGRKGVLELLKRFVRTRVAWWVYALASFLLPTIGLVLNIFVGIEAKIALWKIALTMILAAPLNSLLGGVIFGVGPLGEEAGWRGFALPRLLTRYPTWQASVVLGLLWAFWHTPLFIFSDFRNGMSLWAFCLLYPMSLICISYIMTHFYHWSQGSLLIAVWFHGAVNVTASQMSNTDIWNLSGYSPLTVGFIILMVFGVVALVVGLLAARFTKPEPFPTVSNS